MCTVVCIQCMIQLISACVNWWSTNNFDLLYMSNQPMCVSPCRFITWAFFPLYNGALGNHSKIYIPRAVHTMIVHVNHIWHCLLPIQNMYVEQNTYVHACDITVPIHKWLYIQCFSLMLLVLSWGHFLTIHMSKQHLQQVCERSNGPHKRQWWTHRCTCVSVIRKHMWQWHSHIIVMSTVTVTCLLQ